ncbi:MAG TPA: hypothetical protein PKC45_17735, partial [Gemmatales bacterium]|nr:hypothetical protein [Gemmatales bacterium]
PIFLEANRQWLARMEQVCGGPVDQQRLQADSLRYAWLMRKYQIEAFRRTVPGGGYVVSVIRDFPLASMGLIDYAGQPKWSAVDWSWHSAAPVAHDPWPGVRGPELAALPGGPDLRVPDEAVRTATRLTPELLDELERGGKVLLLPDGKESSL